MGFGYHLRECQMMQLQELKLVTESEAEQKKEIMK
jgi:hypothetical protein